MLALRGYRADFYVLSISYLSFLYFPFRLFRRQVEFIMPKPKHFTKQHQKKARAAVSSESCARNGAKGAAATMTKYGYETLFQASRRKRLLNPSKPELLMIGLLARLDLKPNRDYDREWRIGTSFYTVDFYFKAHLKVIEVKGRIHQVFEQDERAKREERKKALLDEMGIRVLFVEHTELQDVQGVITKISVFLKS